MGKRRGAGRITMRFSFREILGEVGAIVTPYIYNIKFYRLPKDITKVISRVRYRLLEIRVIGFCHGSVNSDFNM